MAEDELELAECYGETYLQESNANASGVILPSISYRFHHCNKIRSNLKKERFILAHGSRSAVPYSREGIGGGQLA